MLVDIQIFQTITYIPLHHIARQVSLKPHKQSLKRGILVSQCWLVVCLFGWLDGRSVGWLVGWLVG